VDERLSIRVFFPNEFELDGFRVLAGIVWKDYHYETDWKGYKYGLAIVQISEEDRRKLFHLINSHLSSENQSLEPENPSLLHLKDVIFHLHPVRTSSRKRSIPERASGTGSR